jgi:pSer/pThr/pTyr-binding forkhead associated (FHA) protein
MGDEPKKKRDEALVERALRKVLDRVGATIDRKLGRSDEARAMTTSQLIARMNRAIDERVRVDKRIGRIAPHHLKLKIEWGRHSEADPQAIRDLETELLAAAIDHINDARLKTLAPVEIESVPDIFVSGVAVDPTYGEFEQELKRQDEEAERAKLQVPNSKDAPPNEVTYTARISNGTAAETRTLRLKPGGRRFNIGRISDNDFQINHPSVSKIHATLYLNNAGALLVSDTGSTNGTFINGRRIAYGEVCAVGDGDVLRFGDVEVRIKRQ